MNYFELFDLPESVLIDEKALRMRYLIAGKKYHPDHVMQETETAQLEAIRMTSNINQAYEVLKDQNKRIKYLLEQHGLIHDQNKNELSQDFLMEMMDINEKMMELEFDFDETIFSSVSEEVKSMENEVELNVNRIGEQFEKEDNKEEILQELKFLYFKQKYLLRIREKLDSFASAS